MTARYRPGSRYDYSNSGYVLLGRIIELETGRSVADEVHARLVQPLGLDDTWFQRIGAESPRPVAMGYQRRNGRWVSEGDGTGLRPTTSLATFYGAAGAMVSTARDLTRWARALYGGDVLKPESVRLMTQFSKDDYGLGVRRKVIGDREAWGHGGSLDGFETSMWYLPAIGTAVVLIWNRRDHESDGVADRLAERVVDVLDPDTTPPTQGTPRLGLPAGVTIASGRARVQVTWPAATDSQGVIRRYEVRRRTTDDSWEHVSLPTPLARHAVLSLPLERMTRVEVRAVDDEHNASAWVEAPRVVPRFLDEADPEVTVGDGWRVPPAADALDGRILRVGPVVRGSPCVPRHSRWAWWRHSAHG